jgi:drug/metabolite transporter (DMT)-like permease
MPINNKRQVDLILMGVAIAWGSTYLAVKTLAKDMPVLPLLASRFLITFIALGLIALFQRKPFTKYELIIGLALGCTQALILYFEAVGVTKTSATNGGLIISLAIILTPIAEGVYSKNWLPPKFFIATFIAFVGVALLVSSHGFRTPNFGDLIFLLAAFLRALHVTAIGHSIKDRPVNTLRLTLVQSMTCALIYSLSAGRSLPKSIAHFTQNDWQGLLYLSLICTVFAFFAQTWAIRHTSPSRASLLLGTEPVWAVVIAMVFGGENLAAIGAIGAIGALLILSGTYFGEKVELAHRKSEGMKIFEST